jgi:hypothetical protein
MMFGDWSAGEDPDIARPFGFPDFFCGFYTVHDRQLNIHLSSEEIKSNSPR